MQSSVSAATLQSLFLVNIFFYGLVVLLIQQAVSLKRPFQLVKSSDFLNY